ncbi:MAG: MFS transporter, partial [Solirubrobacteraceae bacterium]
LLTLGLVKGNDCGWGSPSTVISLAAAVAALALFALHCARARNPLIDGSLFRNRAFTGSSVVAIVFSIAFGAMLLSIVLWDQQVWGWSALQTGLGVAPGPLMVPMFSFLVAGGAIARFGPGRVIAAGATVYAAGAAWWTLRSGLTADYAGEMLPGMLMTGIGVGLTLPTFMSTGASALPPHSFATGSAVVNMLRQVGLAVGVAVLVAVIGTPLTGPAQLAAFRHGWIVIASTALLAAISGAVLLRPRPDRARESARWSSAAASPPALPERQ